jgi:hypothetical protein
MVLSIPYWDLLFYFITEQGISQLFSDTKAYQEISILIKYCNHICDHFNKILVVLFKKNFVGCRLIEKYPKI